MKITKILALALCFAILTVGLIACGSETSADDDNSDADVVSQEQDPTPAIDPDFGSDLNVDDGFGVETIAGTPLSFEADFGISVGGTWFPIWSDASGLIAALGDDYELYSAPSCVFDDGDDKEFSYDSIYVYTNPYDGKDLWYCVSLLDDKFSTARGITVGSTLDDVLAAYGDAFYWEGDFILTYSISGVEGDIDSPNIQFTFDDEVEKIILVEIYYPTNTV